MFTLAEKKQIREKFWLEFKTYSNGRKLQAGKAGKWVLDRTGIKQLSLKFNFDQETAWAGIEIDTTSLDKRIDLFDKLETLRGKFTEAIPHPLIWELEEPITETKTVSRVYAIKVNVSIYNKACWKEVIFFLYEVMDPIEDVFLEYVDYIKYQ